jgi:hypothetical protein
VASTSGIFMFLLLFVVLGFWLNPVASYHSRSLEDEQLDDGIDNTLVSALP